MVKSSISIQDIGTYEVVNSFPKDRGEVSESIENKLKTLFDIIKKN